MSVIKANYNYNVKQGPEIKDDYLLSEDVTEDGEVITTEQKVNYREIQASNGTIELWDLDTMMKSGINVKKLTPHTSNPTKGEGLEKVQEIIEEATKMLDTKK